MKQAKAGDTIPLIIAFVALGTTLLVLETSLAPGNGLIRLAAEIILIGLVAFFCLSRIERYKKTIEALKKDLNTRDQKLKETEAIRRNAEAAQDESEARLDAIINSAPMGIFIKDADGRYIMANHEIERNFGVSAENLIGQTDMEIMPIAFAQRLGLHDSIVLESGQPFEAEERIPSKSGDKTFLTVKFPLFDRNGILSSYCGIMTDITDRTLAETEAQEQNQLLQAIIDAIPAPIFFKDTETAYLGCNKAFEAFIGKDRDEIIGKGVFDISPPELAQKYYDADQKLLNSGEPQVYEAMVKYHDGAMHDVVFHKAVFSRGDNPRGGMVGVMLDITSQNQAIRTSKTLREAIEDMGQAFAIFDERDRLFLCNRSYRALHADVAHTTFPSSSFKDHCKAIAYSGMCKDAQGREDDWIEERLESHRQANKPFEFEHMNGTIHLIFESRLSDGGLIALITDVTDRRRTEMALQASENRLYEAQKLARLGHWSWSLASGDVFWSEEIFRILGLDPLKTRPSFHALARVVSPDDRAWINRAIRRSIATGRDAVLDIQIQRSNGTRRQVHAIGKAVQDPTGQVTAIHGTLHDITELREIEAALKESETRYRAFAADAAHELRTPLAVMKLNLDAMGDSDEIKGLRDDLRAMQRLVDQMMALTRLETLAIRADEYLDLHTTAVDIAAFMAPIAIKEKRMIEVDGTEEPVIIKGNEDSIKQALRNLIENAIRYSARGSTITIGLTKDGALSVSDQGRGIPKDQRKEIFKRFIRADRRGGGSGLGLSIVKRTAEAHGASVEIEDVPTGGARFVLKFPVQDPKDIALNEVLD